jgi:hypothetical protein
MGAGIGSGCGYSGGNSSVDNVTIVNSKIMAASDFGSGIGSGLGAMDGRSTIDNMVIITSNITATGTSGSGIGSGLCIEGASGIWH